MKITLYYAPMSSATPVLWALKEMDVQHELITFDLGQTLHRESEFLKLNPNGKVPTLVVDGRPLFEALAILQWLGDKFGVARGLWPAEGEEGRFTALSWSTWAYVTYGAVLQRMNVAASPRVPQALHSADHFEYAKAQISQLLDLLDARLTQSAHLLGSQFSLADLIVVSVVSYGKWCGASLDRHSKVGDWVQRCQDRPACKAAWMPPPQASAP